LTVIGQFLTLTASSILLIVYHALNICNMMNYRFSVLAMNYERSLYCIWTLYCTWIYFFFI